MTFETDIAEVNFRRPFRLPGRERDYPPGSYRVETDREPIHGLTFHAVRRLATRIHLRLPGVIEVVTIDPGDLERALAEDAL